MNIVSRIFTTLKESVTEIITGRLYSKAEEGKLPKCKKDFPLCGIKII